MYENVKKMVIENFIKMSLKPLAKQTATHMGVSLFWLLAQLGDLLQFGQCKPKQNTNNFVFLLLLGTRSAHRKIPELQDEEEIRG